MGGTEAVCSGHSRIRPFEWTRRKGQTSILYLSQEESLPFNLPNIDIFPFHPYQSFLLFSSLIINYFYANGCKNVSGSP